MVIRKDKVSASQEMTAEERAAKIDELGALPLATFSRYNRKGRAKRNELGDALGITKTQLTRLLGNFENAGLAQELEESQENVPNLRQIVERAFEEYGGVSGQFRFIRNPDIAAGTMKDLQTLFLAYGFVPDWNTRK